MIKSIDKATAVKLGNEIHEAAKAIAAKYGVSLKGTGGTYSDCKFTKKVEFFIPSAESKNVTEAHIKAYNGLGILYGLKSEWLNVPFKDGRSNYKIIGLNTRKSKNNVMLEQIETGRSFSCSADYVKRFFTK